MSGTRQHIHTEPLESRSPRRISSVAMSEHGSQVEEDNAYHPQDAIGSSIKATLITTGAGAFVSTVQNTLTKQNVGALGVFTRTGGTIAVFGRIIYDYRAVELGH